MITCHKQFIFEEAISSYGSLNGGESIDMDISYRLEN